MRRRILYMVILLITTSASWKTGTRYMFTELLHFPPIKGEEPVITKEGAELGRYLFHDPRLSRNGTLSCASCHKQEFAFSDGERDFSNNVHGLPTRRNTMPLFNLLWYDSFGWDGRSSSMETQVMHALEDEMGMDTHSAVNRIADDARYQAMVRATYGVTSIDGELVADALTQFLGTLISHRSKYDRVLAREAYFTPDEYAGFVMMNDQSMADCLHCHTTDAHALGTTGGFSNNGLDPFLEATAYSDQGRGEVTKDPDDVARFKIPSLRNIAITAPYMHDGRFATLEEVLDHYSQGVHNGLNVDPKMAAGIRKGVNLNATEKRQIIAFLHTLTDSAFITDPAFSDPFRRR